MVTIKIIELISHKFQSPYLLRFSEIYTLCCLLLFFHKTQVNECEVVKRVKICKKVSFRVENLKIEVILIFFESLLGITRCHFSRVHVLLYRFCFNLCLYLVLLVFLGVFDQTSATKTETCVCFLFFIRYYEFWKRFHGYHSNSRIYT